MYSPASKIKTSNCIYVRCCLIMYKSCFMTVQDNSSLACLIFLSLYCYVVSYTHRSNLPATGRVLPVAPSAATSTPVRNGRTLPVTPAGSSTMQTRMPGGSLPVVSNTAVQNQKRSSGRTLPTLPSNTPGRLPVSTAIGRLPVSTAIDRNRSQLSKKSTQSQREFPFGCII